MKRRFLILLIAIAALGCSNRKHELADVIRYNESKGIATLDPAFASNLKTIWGTIQLFNGLVQLNDSLKVEPAIAKSWEISPNQTLYTFHLRTDVTFHDDPAFPHGIGRKVVAADFAYSFGRLLDDNVGSPCRWIFAKLDTTFHGNGLFAANDSTFQLKIQAPAPFLLGMLAMPPTSVVPKEAVERYKKDFRKHPVGTGPFMFKLWREGEMLVLVKNPKYFEFDAKGQRLPYLKAVNITFITDKYSEFMEFIRGNLDFISGINQSTKDEIITSSGKLNPKYADRIKMLEIPYLNTEYLGFTLNLPPSHPLMNPLVRKAIAIGFDRHKMIKYLRKNLTMPAESGIIPPSIPGYKPTEKPYAYNPTLAAELLRKAGYPHGQGIPPITVTSLEDYADLLEFIQHDLAAIGITLNIDIVPGGSFQQEMASGKLPFFRGSWIADYPDPENYMALFYSKNESPNGPNYTRFKSSEFDKLYLESFFKTGEARSQAFSKMDKILAKHTPLIPLYFDKTVRFVKKNIVGLEPNPMNYLYLKKARKINGSSSL
nr:ABC transporter substrate-binding protein [uncultured Acetobacteroides sp.]